VRYMRGGEQGVAQKRNMGALNSTGNICFFVDDDIILDRNYVEKILEVYSKYPNTLGVAGHIVNMGPHPSLKGKLSNIINRVLRVYHYTPDACKVRPLGITYPYPLTKIINCEWLNAGCVSYKKEVFRKFKWDENLKRYSISEDKDLSYKIYKCHPFSLFMTPYAKAFHSRSPAGRFSSRYIIYMTVCHSVYLYFKNFKQTLRNSLTFTWGLFFGHLACQILSRNAHNVIHQIGAYLHLFKNFKEIKKGNFASLDQCARIAIEKIMDFGCGCD
ncbi:MAG: glycosyltransferase family 2 protein, partial [Fervidobacterium sp.]